MLRITFIMTLAFSAAWLLFGPELTKPEEPVCHAHVCLLPGAPAG